MAADEPGAAWHFEGEFGRSRIIVRMAEQGGRSGIKVRLDAEGQETGIFSLTLEQAGFLADALPAVLTSLRNWQDQQRYEIETYDPFADLIEQDEAGSASKDAGPVKSAPVPTGAEAGVSLTVARRSRDDTRTARTPKRRGQSWTAEEETQIVDAHALGQSVDYLAALLQRSPLAIRKRLEKLGLVDVTE